jgi:hypothetical protein
MLLTCNLSVAWKYSETECQNAEEFTKKKQTNKQKKNKNKQTNKKNLRFRENRQINFLSPHFQLYDYKGSASLNA